MNWFSLALIGPFLYAITNHIDKVLLEKYFKSGGVGTLMLFSSLLSALALPILYLADPAVLDISAFNMLVLGVVGLLNIMVLLFYFYALRDDEASVTIVFYQLVPVFGYMLGYFILGETLTDKQMVAMAIIMLGATIISFELGSGSKIKFRRQTVIFMLMASFCWALGSVTFKFVALEENVLRSLFWEHIMLTIVGILLFTFAQAYRTHFLAALRENSKSIIALNFSNETLYMTGTVVFSFAYLQAPISLILLTNSFQAFFVLLIGVFFTLFFPSIISERIQPRHLAQKFIAIAITGIGTSMLLA